MNWTAVAPDHWTAQINGQPISLKKWPHYWIIAQRFSRTNPAIQFKSLSEAVFYLTGERRRKISARPARAAK